MTRADRDRQHKEAVEENKTYIRRKMRRGEHLYGEAALKTAMSEGDYAGVDALEELMPEIREHNARVGGGTKARVQEHLDQERRRDYERRQRREAERAVQQVEDYARNRPTVNLDAVGQVEAPTSDPEEERYRKEMEAFEEKRRQAQKEGYAYTLVAPKKPRKRRQAITPY